MQTKIAASVMCADLLNLSSALKQLEQLDIEYIHVDIMDGLFVPNFTFGTDFCAMLRKAAKIPLDIHLMVQNPERHISMFAPQEGEYVSVHQESTVHLQRTLALIKSFGAKAAVALNPATPIETIEYVLSDIDMVLLMTVNPGYAGQKLVEQTVGKISDMRKYLDNKGFGHIEIEVDGNCSFENSKRMKNAGANIFVSGSSGIFTKNMPLKDATNEMRKHLR